MLEHFSLLRNIGQFDNVADGARLPLSKLSVVYAENGRGKTTLAEILRSVSVGDALLVGERQRLSAAHAPQVVLGLVGGATRIFENGTWSGTSPEIAVFDDNFVAQNVCSGMEIGTDHRQNLHELILGGPGVALNAQLKAHVDRIEQHNRDLRTKADVIPARARRGMTVDAFCTLGADTDVEQKIAETERSLAAAKSAEAVRTKEGFGVLSLPAFDLEEIEEVLSSSLDSIEKETLARLNAHFASLGDRGEQWVESGMNRVTGASEGNETGACPFCAQSLDGSQLIEHYRVYFGDAYRGLLQRIDDALKRFENHHGGDIPAAFERSVRVAVERQAFWKPFAEVPEVDVDTAEIARRWKAARDGLHSLFQQKRGAPLEAVSLPDETREAVARYDEMRAEIAGFSDRLAAANQNIALAKERALTGNAQALAVDLERYLAIRDRQEADIVSQCEAYLEEKRLKAETEELRDATRRELDEYRQQVFPAYENAINDYLRRFNAGFRLGSVTSVNNRSGSSCTYSVVIGQTEVPVASDQAGRPSFRTTLSAGDRNALALAFFFASLDRDGNLASKIVVIDDPMTSLDEHRSLTTVQEVLGLVRRVQQVIVLSHSKPFLCAVWKDGDRVARSAIKIARQQAGSTLVAWDVSQDSITDHDRRHALVRRFLAGEQGINDREVATALRPMLEAYCRVAYPEDFPPERLLGPFLGICDQRLAANRPLLSQADIIELRALLDYANLFHHDSNAAYETQVINDQQLVHFAERTIAFTRRS